MTVVVGIRSETGVLLAADATGSSAWGDQRERKDGKVVQLDEKVAIAYCGSYRLGQVLRYELDPLPKLPLGRDEHKWAVKDFVFQVRHAAKEAGVVEIKDGVESIPGGFLLAVRNRLFTVEDDWQVSEDEFPWATDGSGGEAAAGHLRGALKGLTEPVDEKRLKNLATKAIETACDLNAFCRGTISYVSTVRFTDKEREIAQEVLRV